MIFRSFLNPSLDNIGDFFIIRKHHTTLRLFKFQILFFCFLWRFNLFAWGRCFFDWRRFFYRWDWFFVLRLLHSSIFLRVNVRLRNLLFFFRVNVRLFLLSCSPSLLWIRCRLDPMSRRLLRLLFAFEQWLLFFWLYCGTCLRQIPRTIWRVTRSS